MTKDLEPVSVYRTKALFRHTQKQGVTEDCENTNGIRYRTVMKVNNSVLGS